jgi:pimeloyl-ACP methyl ester carboxylesterase
MLHGSYDPHPGRMILASLRPCLPQIEYREWDHCGHYPWLEREVREEFFSTVRAWLLRHLAPTAGHGRRARVRERKGPTDPARP